MSYPELEKLLRANGFLHDENGHWYRINEQGQREEPYLIMPIIIKIIGVYDEVIKKYSGPPRMVKKKGHGVFMSYNINTLLTNLPQKHLMISDCPDLNQDYSKDNILPAKMVAAGTGDKIIWKCHICCHIWITTGNSRYQRKTKCPQCSGRVASALNNLSVTHPDLAKEYSKENPLPVNQIKPGSGRIVWWQCSLCGWKWQAKVAYRVKRKSGCPACSGRVATPTNCLAVTHPELLKEYSSKNEIPPDQIKAGTGKTIIWECNNCGREWTSTGDARIRGCKVCLCQKKRRGKHDPI